MRSEDQQPAPDPAVPATPLATPAATPAPPPRADVPDEPSRPAPPLTPPPPREQPRGLPASLVAVLAFAGIAALLAVLYLFLVPRQQQAASEPEKALIEQPGPAGSATPVHPFAKHLEVTGIRLSGGAGGKVKIQFLVVNHSGAELPDMKMVVTLASGGRNFFEFPARVPSLGPYEVKELATAATTELKPYELPDWQMFRTQFRITE